MSRRSVNIEVCSEKQLDKLANDMELYVAKKPCSKCSDEEKSVRVKLKGSKTRKTIGTCICNPIGKIAKLGSDVYVIEKDTQTKRSITEYLEDMGIDDIREFFEITRSQGLFLYLCKLSLVYVDLNAVWELREVLSGEGRGDEEGSREDS